LNNSNRIMPLAVDIIKRLVRIEFKIGSYLLFKETVRYQVTVGYDIALIPD
jgi:hypothetical protein